MGTSASQTQETAILQADDLQHLLEALHARHYQVIGPTVSDNAVVLEEIRSVSDLPVGWTDEQEGGVYRLRRREDDAFFGYVVGPRSWKQFLNPPNLRLWRARRENGNLQFMLDSEEAPKMAFLGVRPCELEAIAVQDRVFLGKSYVDPIYAERRQRLFVIVVQCAQASGTCFCASMGTGPWAESGYDLALTEVIGKRAHHFLVEVGSERGAELLKEIACEPATEAQIAQARQLSRQAAHQQSRTMDTEGLKELLYRSYEHPHWEEVGARCLTCGNCTMVCPTCFCMTVEDSVDLAGRNAERRRRWDSCFMMDFSYITGGSVRYSPAARYRQWLTHKLATWHDQFGVSGCVGCGRCITWCPVAIDLTEEVRAFQGEVRGSKEKTHENA
jgi:ferredoxin